LRSQRIGVLLSVASAATLLTPAHRLLGQQKMRQVSTYPTFAPGQTVYVVPPSEAYLIIDTLSIPAGDTIKAGPGVGAINWTVSTLNFGANATIDLSASPTQAPAGSNGAGPPPQAGYCAQGAAGAPGGNGSPGTPGVDLNISGIKSVDNGSDTGSLWIKTDGGPGGNGGTGGRGQQGGGQHKFWSHPFDYYTCHAGNGGAGGPGGSGGLGGRVANVSITFSVTPAPIQLESGVAATCGSSTRPPAVQGGTGQVVVWGGTGCAGTNGQKGPDGGAG